MNRYDYYSGEPVSSPEFISQNTTNMTNIVENTDQNIQYSYDPNMRYSQMMQQRQQNMYQPGGYGYNQPMYNPYQQQTPFMNSPINPYQQQMPYGNGVGFVGNPAFAYMSQMNNFQPLNLNFEDKVVHVDGFNTGSSILLSPDAEDICNKLQMEMMAEQEEAIERRNERFQGYFNNNGYNNYYGMPYMSTWEDQSVNMKYRRMIDDMRQEAIEKRRNFNKKLSRLTHNYLNDDVSEDDIDKIYDGYTYTIPASTMKYQSECDRFSRMVPVSNQAAYINHYNEVSKFYNSIVPQNCNMQEFLHQQGVLQTYYNLEEELHRRRDVSQFYQGDSYKRFLRKAVKNRDGGQQNNISQSNSQLNNFPLLSNSAQVLDDGSISITAPSWMGGGQTHIQFNNELEQHFEENRHRFLQSIYAQEGINNGT